MGAAGLTRDLGLLVGWFAALAAWLGVARLLPRLWPEPAAPDLDRPWRSLLWVLGAMAASLGLAQLRAHGVMLVIPGIGGAIAAAVEELVLYGPILMVPRWLDERETSWLPRRHVWARVVIGLALAELAITACVAPHGVPAWRTAHARLLDIYQLPYLVRVFCQDVAVAILFLRLAAVMGRGWAISLIAAGFAVAQVHGAVDGEAVARLLVDTGLGAIALAIVSRSADVWWLVWVHFALDALQGR